MSVPANFYDTYDIVASPTDDAEVVVARLAAVSELLPDLTVHLEATINVAIAAAATSAILRVRRNGLTGDQVGADWPITYDPAATFANVSAAISAADNPGNFAGAVYVLTLECEDAATASTINAVHLGARVC